MSESRLFLDFFLFKTNKNRAVGESLQLSKVLFVLMYLTFAWCSDCSSRKEETDHSRVG